MDGYKNVEVGKGKVNLYEDIINSKVHNFSHNVTQFLTKDDAAIVHHNLIIAGIVLVIATVIFIFIAYLVAKNFYFMISKRFDYLLSLLAAFVVFSLIVLGLLSTMISISMLFIDKKLENVNQVYTKERVKVKNIYTENPLNNDDNDSKKFNYVSYDLEGKTGLVKIRKQEFKEKMATTDKSINIYTDYSFVDKSKIDEYYKATKRELQKSNNPQEVFLTSNNGDEMKYLSK